MKFIDLGICEVGDVVSWLLGQDGWMKRAWGWEVIGVCVEKADTLARQISENGDAGEEKKDGENGEKMEVDSSGAVGTANGDGKNARSEIFEKIVEGVGECYERQGELEREWLKEWFRMVVGSNYEGFSGLEADGWAGEILREAEEFRKFLS